MELVEEWRPIEGFPGYIISNLGRVYSERFKRFLKLSVKKSGYVYVALSDSNKKIKHLRLHRLVAKAFIPNPDNLPEVNHKDENKQKNRADNLEWCTSKYNANYGSMPEKRKNFNSVAVRSIDPESGKEVRRYNSMTEADKDMGGKNISHISQCCNGKRKTCKGLKWEVIDVKV